MRHRRWRLAADMRGYAGGGVAAGRTTLQHALAGSACWAEPSRDQSVMARHPRPGDHDSGAALAAAEGSVLWPGTFTGTQLPNSALSGSTSGAAPSCTAKRYAAFMRFYRFLGCPRLVVPELVRIMDRAAHPEGQVARLSWLDLAWVLQQQLLHF